MSVKRNNVGERRGPSGGGPFAWRGLAIWLIGGLLLGSLAAWAAVDAQLYFAPLLIFPLLVGVGLGGVLVLLMRVGQVGHRPTILLGTVLAALAAAVGQHYFLYLTVEKRERQLDSAIKNVKNVPPELIRQLPEESPKNFCEFMRRNANEGRTVFRPFTVRHGGAWALWGVEGLLTVAAALGVVIPAVRLPFCSRCRSWYRVTRSARFPGEAIPRFAETLGVEINEKVRSGRCRLLNCSSGCNTTGCELSWEDFDGNTFFAQVWLDTAGRDAVVRVFDELQRGMANAGKNDE